MSRNSEKTLLTDQREALMTYLEDLLLQVEDYQATPEASETIQDPQQSGLTEARQTPVIDATTAENKTRLTEQARSTPTAQTALINENNETIKSALPIAAWTEFPLQVLTVEIAGYLYAVPLKNLHGIVPMPQRLTQIPSKIQWFLGLFRNRGITVKVIDLLKLWHQKAPIDEARSQHEFVLLIDEGRFGFVASKVKTIMTLRRDDIQWRQVAGFNGVLSGNIRSNMATLIDVNALIDGLHAGIWAGRR